MNTLSPYSDEKTFKRKYLLKLLSHPVSLIPFLAGITQLLAMWTFSINSGIGIFTGIAAILGSAGIFLTRLILGNASLSAEVLEKMETAALKKRELALDDLDRRLVADGDPRTEAYLRDLRAMAGAFGRTKARDTLLTSRISFDLLSGIEVLFNQCIQTLEKTLELYHLAEKMSSDEARAPILKHRETMLKEVSESIKQLGKLMLEIEAASMDIDSQETDLARIRAELDQSLDVAKIVKQRMHSLEEEISVRRVREEPRSLRE